jgi:hypothetical protein
MPIVDVCINGLSGSEFQEKGLLDTGSNLNFISASLFKRLAERTSLKVKKCCLVVQTMNGAAKCARDVIELQIVLRDSSN